jgi:hypothetical protein
MLYGNFKQVFRSQLLVRTLLTSDDCTCSSTLINEFRRTVVSNRCLSVIRWRGSRGTLRLRCPSGLCKAGGMADRRGATIYSDVQLLISAKVVSYLLQALWSIHQNMLSCPSSLIKMPIRVLALAFDLCAL